MSTQPVILYLRIGADGEPNFDPNAQLSDLEAVTQAISTNLKLFQGEWWENLNAGVPMLQQIIGQRATPNALQVMALILSKQVSATPFVNGVENPVVTFHSVSRMFSFSCVAQTAFGNVPILFSPGMTASLGQ